VSVKYEFDIQNRDTIVINHNAYIQYYLTVVTNVTRIDTWTAEKPMNSLLQNLRTVVYVTY